MENRALVFIKPDAANSTVIDFINRFLAGWGVELSDPLTMRGSSIAAEGTIDSHYFAIALTAVHTRPAEYSMQSEAVMQFQSAYGISWEKALESGRLLNAVDAQEQLGGISGIELNEIWKRCEQVKMAPGLYAGKTSPADSEDPETPLFIINGFYPGQREVFTDPEAQVLLYEARFSPETLSWEHFRTVVIGATDPTAAADGSLRAQILKRWQEFGLASPPETSSNGVHASAGPVEGLRERMVWLGTDPSADPLARRLVSLGCTSPFIDRLLENAEITLPDQTGPVFDLTEDMDTGPAARLIAGAVLTE
jgi:nucleoside diphosphate kinase